MANPFKALKSLFKKKRPRELPLNLYAELDIIWPDGTWTIGKTARENVDCDNTARGVILDVWAMDDFITAEALAGYELNPGRFGSRPEPIPKGWRPSEKILKMFFAKYDGDVNMMHYMVGQLQHLKHLRP